MKFCLENSFRIFFGKIMLTGLHTTCNRKLVSFSNPNAPLTPVTTTPLGSSLHQHLISYPFTPTPTCVALMGIGELTWPYWAGFCFSCFPKSTFQIVERSWGQFQRKPDNPWTNVRPRRWSSRGRLSGSEGGVKMSRWKGLRWRLGKLCI